ncbi:hypothetical protein EI94DRAFT_1716153 [Lactarius quietus]|nr:hypothetical protein EI94DRAFT_1716153 [Lactarius quietus]
MGTTPPPLGVKITYYRLLNMTTVLSFGITKGILTYMGKSTAPTTLDWVSGAVLAVALYWIGLYEERSSKKWEWFFQVDLAPTIGYRAKCLGGEALGLLFFLDGLVVIFPLSIFLGNLVVLLIVRSVPHFPHDAQWGVHLSFVVCAHTLWYSLSALTGRVRTRIRGWQRVKRFVSDYGPAPLAEQYGWFGALGAIMRLFCGVALLVALIVLSLVIYYHYAWLPSCVRRFILVTPGEHVDSDLYNHCTGGLLHLYSRFYYSRQVARIIGYSADYPNLFVLRIYDTPIQSVVWEWCSSKSYLICVQ